MLNLSLARPAVAFLMDPDRTPDLLSDAQLDRLEGFCTVLSRRKFISTAELAQDEVLARVEILITGWGCPVIDGAVLAAAPRLKAIGHTASSVKAFLGEAVWQRGIVVISAAGANAVPVAEYSLAAILLANKHAFATSRRYAELKRKWQPSWTAPGEPGNFGAVVGLVGASRVGRHLLSLLRPFELSVLLTDPTITAGEATDLGAALVPLEILLERADVISLHAPALPQTRHMLGARELARMKDGATLINTARGMLIDESALLAELRSGRLSAVLDVTDPEPPSPESELFSLPNVFITPHIAGAAGLETRRMADLVIDEVERFVAGAPLQHVVDRSMLATIG